MHSSAFFLLKNKFAFIIRIMYLYSTTYVYEGKIFAFIGLHNTKTIVLLKKSVSNRLYFFDVSLGLVMRLSHSPYKKTGSSYNGLSVFCSVENRILVLHCLIKIRKR